MKLPLTKNELADYPHIIWLTGMLLILANASGQNFKKSYYGVPMTCVTDSTSLTQDTVIYLKQAIPSGQGVCPKAPTYKYTGCVDSVDYIDFVLFWPTQIVLYFKDKTYFFLHSPRPTDPNIKYGQEDFTVTYSYDNGTLNIDKKNKLMTLTSKKHNWSRTYHYSYSKQEDILTLKYK